MYYLAIALSWWLVFIQISLILKVIIPENITYFTVIVSLYIFVTLKETDKCVLYPQFISSTLHKYMCLKRIHLCYPITIFINAPNYPKQSFAPSALHISWPVTSCVLRIVPLTRWTILLVHDTTMAHVIFGTIGWVWIVAIWFLCATKRTYRMKERTWRNKPKKLTIMLKLINNPSSLNKRNHKRRWFRHLSLISIDFCFEFLLLLRSHRFDQEMIN